jgi:hypothetical protein
MGFDIKYGLDTMVYVYKRTLPFQKDFLTNRGWLHYPPFLSFIKEIGRIEEIYLKNFVRQEIYDSNPLKHIDLNFID